MQHLAERDAAEGDVDEVVQRGMVGFAEELPGGAAEGRDRGRLVEVQAVGPVPPRELVIDESRAIIVWPASLEWTLQDHADRLHLERA